MDEGEGASRFCKRRVARYIIFRKFRQTAVFTWMANFGSGYVDVSLRVSILKVVPKLEYEIHQTVVIFCNWFFFLCLHKTRYIEIYTPKTKWQNLCIKQLFYNLFENRYVINMWYWFPCKFTMTLQTLLSYDYRIKCSYLYVLKKPLF